MRTKVGYLVLGWCFASSSLVVAEERANFQVTCGGNVRLEPPPGGAVEIGSMKLNTNGTIESEQMTSMSEQMNAVIAKNEALTAEVAALKDVNASLWSDLDELTGSVATLMDGVKNLTATAAEAKKKGAQNNAPSNVVYHSGGDLDFTPGSDSLAVLEQTLVGVTEFQSDIYIKGTDIQGSVVNRLLMDVVTIGGSLRCEDNQASFEVGDSKLVFEALTSVTEINMANNNDENKQRFTGASFPALAFVPGLVYLNNNAMLKTISMPNLVGVSDGAYFQVNPALTSLQLPRLVTVGDNFHIYDTPSLATGAIQVSQGFESMGGGFAAFTMIAGFQCTAGNGLSAVVATASSTDSSNIATSPAPLPSRRALGSPVSNSKNNRSIGARRRVSLLPRTASGLMAAVAACLLLLNFFSSCIVANAVDMKCGTGGNGYYNNFINPISALEYFNAIAPGHNFENHGVKSTTCTDALPTINAFTKSLPGGSSAPEMSCDGNN
eukprot:gene695-28897_t